MRCPLSPSGPARMRGGVPVATVDARAVAWTLPATSSFDPGVTVPIPILPLFATKNFELLPIMKLIEPPEAMLLIRYS